MTLFAVWCIFLCQGESTGWFVQHWSPSCLQVAECQLIDVWFLVPVAAPLLWKHRPVSLTLRPHITFGSGAIRVAKISMKSLEIRLCCTGFTPFYSMFWEETAHLELISGYFKDSVHHAYTHHGNDDVLAGGVHNHAAHDEDQHWDSSPVCSMNDLLWCLISFSIMVINQRRSAAIWLVYWALCSQHACASLADYIRCFWTPAELHLLICLDLFPAESWSVSMNIWKI